MNDRPVNLYSGHIQHTNRASSIPTRKQTSAIDSDTIKGMFASLKVLGFEKATFLCENKLIKSVTEDDIKNLITQAGLTNNKVNIDWLFHLTDDGIKKIQKIIGDLQIHKKHIFTCFLNRKEWNHFFELFKENVEHGLCASRAIGVYQKVLVLKEDFRIVENESILLDEKELVELFREDLEMINLSRVRRFSWSESADILSSKIAAANSSDLKVAEINELTLILHEVLCKKDLKSFVKDNPGFVIQLIMRCFIERVYRKKDVLELYVLCLNEIFPEKKAELAGKWPQDIKLTSQIMNSPNLEKDILNSDAQGWLFEHLLSINDQWSLARTNKSYLQAYAAFCKSNLKNNWEVGNLKKRGFSEIQIFIQHPRLRKDRFVPRCQTGLNSLALEVLGPNAIEQIKKGLLSTFDAINVVIDFNEESSNSKTEVRGPERYRRDGLLSKTDIGRMTSAEKACLCNHLIQFSINSGQLNIHQAIKAKASFEDRVFYSNSDYVFSSVKDRLRSVFSLFVLNKLTVKRYLELKERQIRFLSSTLLCGFIEQNKITVESALFLLELIDKYKQSGWYGLRMMITSNHSE